MSSEKVRLSRMAGAVAANCCRPSCAACWRGRSSPSPTSSFWPASKQPAARPFGRSRRNLPHFNARFFHWHLTSQNMWLEKFYRPQSPTVSRSCLERSRMQHVLLDRTIVQFCSAARAQFELCANSESVRQFLLDHLEKVVLLNDRVTLHGRVPFGKTDDEEHRVPFSISSEITTEERYQDRRKMLLRADKEFRQELITLIYDIDHQGLHLFIAQP